MHAMKLLLKGCVRVLPGIGKVSAVVIKLTVNIIMLSGLL